MNNRISYSLESSTILALRYSQEIANQCNLPLITKETFLATIILMPDSALHKYLIKKGIEYESIQKKVSRIVSDINIDYTITTLELAEIGIFNIDENILKILNSAKFIAVNYYARDYIKTTDVIAGFSQVFPNVFKDIMTTFLPSFGTPSFLNKETYMEDEDSIPPELSGFITILNKEFSSKERNCPICGREDETNTLIRILMKKTKRNAILVGEPGVGKTALVQKFTWMIVTGNCPEKFRNYTIISLDVNSIVAGTHLRGSAEARFDILKKFLEDNPNYILFIDEVHLLLGAGACREGELDLGNALKPLLATGKTMVIGATTANEYEQYFSKDAALKRRFEKITVKEPKASEVYNMIKNQIKLLEKYHNVKISRELVDFIILNAACFNYETKNPDRTLDLIDKSMVCAELNNRKEVSKQDVLSNFAVYKKKFEKMSILEKTGTAYHEAGHCIAHMFSNAVLEYVPIAVSIMPAETYLGVNVSEIDEDVTPTKNKNYYIQLIGCYLAGRIAEEMYSKNLTAGASVDLEKATKLANLVVTKYGLDEEFARNRIFTVDSQSPMYTEQVISKINIHVARILDEAYAYATNLLNEKKVYLELLANALLEHGILSSKMIDDIFKTVNM